MRSRTTSGTVSLDSSLHFDRVDDGHELALGLEAEPHDRPFDGLDHTKGLRVPPGDLVQIVVVSSHGIGVYRGAGGGATVPRRATAVRRGGAGGSEGAAGWARVVTHPGLPRIRTCGSVE